MTEREKYFVGLLEKVMGKLKDGLFEGVIAIHDDDVDECDVFTNGASSHVIGGVEVMLAELSQISQDYLTNGFKGGD